jgi:hypothetical protein
MNHRGIEHIALHVESLTQAENLYTALFDLEVVDRRQRLQPEVDEKAQSGASESFDSEGEVAIVDRSVLEGNGLRLVLYRVIADYTGQGRLSHICIRVPSCEADHLVQRAANLGCVVRLSAMGQTCLEDPYEVCWELSSAD